MAAKKILDVKQGAGQTQLSLQQKEQSRLEAGSRHSSRGLCFFALRSEPPGPEAELP